MFILCYQAMSQGQDILFNNNTFYNTFYNNYNK